MIEDNRILGRTIIQSSLVGNGTVILGDFSYLMIGMFGGTDLIVDPYSTTSSAAAKSQRIHLRTFRCDSQKRSARSIYHKLAGVFSGLFLQSRPNVTPATPHPYLDALTVTSQLLERVGLVHHHLFRKSFVIVAVIRQANKSFEFFQ